MLELKDQTIEPGYSPRERAVDRLGSFLKDPNNSLLYPYQIDVIRAVYNSLVDGKKAGYISLPPGTGKSVIITILLDILDMNSVVLSPTTDILLHISRQASSKAPNLKVANYHARSKSRSGDVLNTTYQSFLPMTRRKEVEPGSVELMVLDEVHASTGPKRHTFLREYPNALKIGLTATSDFEQIKGYQKRGWVQADEEWLELFNNCFYDMPVTTAIEAGYSVPIDYQLIRTNIKVDNVQVYANGEYNKAQLEKALRQEVRKAMVIGLLAGPDKIPPGVTLTNIQLEEVEIGHQEIAGKRAFYFGFSVDEVDHLAAELNNLGVTAAAFHGQVDPQHRADVLLPEHRNGDIQVLLGVDTLGVGVDSPETEVLILGAPTGSGQKALQRLGRGLRLSPASGKSTLYVKEFFDNFAVRHQAPVFVTDLLDPYTILRGSRTGLEAVPVSKRMKSVRPVITFTGVEIDLIRTELETRNILRHRLSQATLTETANILTEAVAQIQANNPGEGLYNVFQRLAQELPYFVPSERQDQLLRGMADIDTNVVEAAKKSLILINIKTILSAIEPYVKYFKDPDDLLQAAIVGGLEGVKRMTQGSLREIPQQLFFAARRAALNEVASETNLPTELMEAGWEAAIVDLLGQSRVSWKQPQTFEDRLELANLVAEIKGKTGLPVEVIQNYIDTIVVRSEELVDETVNIDQEIIGEETSNIIYRYRTSLPQRFAQVLELRFGFENDTQWTLKDIKGRMGLSIERIRQIEAEGLGLLKHPSRIVKLEQELLMTQGFYPDRINPFIRSLHTPYTDNEERWNKLLTEDKLDRLYVEVGSWDLRRVLALSDETITALRSKYIMSVRDSDRPRRGLGISTLKQLVQVYFDNTLPAFGFTSRLDEIRRALHLLDAELEGRDLGDAEREIEEVLSPTIQNNLPEQIRYLEAYTPLPPEDEADKEFDFLNRQFLTIYYPRVESEMLSDLTHQGLPTDIRSKIETDSNIFGESSNRLIHVHRDVRERWKLSQADAELLEQSLNKLAVSKKAGLKLDKVRLEYGIRPLSSFDINPDNVAFFRSIGIHTVANIIDWTDGFRSLPMNYHTIDWKQIFRLFEELTSQKT